MDHTNLNELSAPTRRLAAACLLSAYRDAWKPLLAGNEKSERRLVIERTRKWFASHSQREWSFEWLCLVLDLEPTAIRQQVLTEWRQFKLTSHQTQQKED